MRDDGRDEFRQVSFNQSSDYEPTVLDNGKVLFSRWDHAGNINGIHLYQMNPDGTELELLYGAESHLTGTNNGAVQFISAREMPDGRIMAIVRPFDHPELGGAITIIDTPTYVENTQPVASSAGMTGPAQTAATPNQVRTDLEPSHRRPLQLGVSVVGRHGARADDVVDLPPRGAGSGESHGSDLRAVHARASGGDESCAGRGAAALWRVDVRPDDPDAAADRDRRGGRVVADVVAAQPRRTPTSIPDKLPGIDFDAELAAEGAGIINIRSVYDLDGVASVNIAADCGSRHYAAGAAPSAVLADREGGGDSGRGHGRPRQHGVRPEHPAGHARSDRLRADRARRLRAHQSAGQRGAGAERSRRQWPTHVGASSELAASRAGPRADLQRVPRADEQSLARPQHGVQRRRTPVRRALASRSRTPSARSRRTPARRWPKRAHA